MVASASREWNPIIPRPYIPDQIAADTSQCGDVPIACGKTSKQRAR